MKRCVVIWVRGLCSAAFRAGVCVCFSAASTLTHAQAVAVGSQAKAYCRAGIAEAHIREAFTGDPGKADGVIYALRAACRDDIVDLTPTPAYVALVDALRRAREDFERTGSLSREALSQLENAGVTRRELSARGGRTPVWQLEIEPQAKSQVRPKPAATVASFGFVFVEAFHQLRPRPGFEPEKIVLLTAIERAADQILRHADENGDGRIGWGRIWFKGSNGLVLHSSAPGQNLYFGGYTYFARANAAGQATCAPGLALAEETFDHAHNILFLLETYLISRNAALAKRILDTTGQAFDDTFGMGAPDAQLGSAGWNYWKQLATHPPGGPVGCEIGREIKNTNLRMGAALFAFSEILRRNEAAGMHGTHASAKYRDRALRVIATNDHEILDNNNFGYQGIHSREVELAQADTDAKRRPVYGRTQGSVSLAQPSMRQLSKIIAEGNAQAGKKIPDQVVLCKGDAQDPVGDRDVAGACWNHLPFEAEDYFRIARYSGLWTSRDGAASARLLDAMTRNLAAAEVLYEGRASNYAHYFPGTAQRDVSNLVTNATYFGFFCMGRNIATQPAARALPPAHVLLLQELNGICAATPASTPETGVTWRRGYKFYELYLTADRFQVPAEDWLLSKKK